MKVFSARPDRAPPVLPSGMLVEQRTIAPTTASASVSVPVPVPVASVPVSEPAPIASMPVEDVVASKADVAAIVSSLGADQVDSDDADSDDNDDDDESVDNKPVAATAKPSSPPRKADDDDDSSDLDVEIVAPDGSLANSGVKPKPEPPKSSAPAAPTSKPPSKPSSEPPASTPAEPVKTPPKVDAKPAVAVESMKPRPVAPVAATAAKPPLESAKTMPKLMSQQTTSGAARRTCDQCHLKEAQFRATLVGDVELNLCGDCKQLGEAARRLAQSPKGPSKAVAAPVVASSARAAPPTSASTPNAPLVRKATVKDIVQSARDKGVDPLDMLLSSVHQTGAKPAADEADTGVMATWNGKALADAKKRLSNDERFSSVFMEMKTIEDDDDDEEEQEAVKKPSAIPRVRGAPQGGAGSQFTAALKAAPPTQTPSPAAAKQTPVSPRPVPATSTRALSPARSPPRSPQRALSPPRAPTVAAPAAPASNNRSGRKRHHKRGALAAESNPRFSQVFLSLDLESPQLRSGRTVESAQVSNSRSRRRRNKRDEPSPLSASGVTPHSPTSIGNANSAQRLKAASARMKYTTLNPGARDDDDPAASSNDDDRHGGSANALLSPRFATALPAASKSPANRHRHRSKRNNNGGSNGSAVSPASAAATAAAQPQQSIFVSVSEQESAQPATRPTWAQSHRQQMPNGDEYDDLLYGDHDDSDSDSDVPVVVTTRIVPAATDDSSDSDNDDPDQQYREPGEIVPKRAGGSQRPQLMRTERSKVISRPGGPEVKAEIRTDKPELTPQASLEQMVEWNIAPPSPVVHPASSNKSPPQVRKTPAPATPAGKPPTAAGPPTATPPTATQPAATQPVATQPAASGPAATTAKSVAFAPINAAAASGKPVAAVPGSPMAGEIDSPPLSPRPQLLTAAEAAGPRPQIDARGLVPTEPLPNMSQEEALQWTAERLVSKTNPLELYTIDESRRLGKGGFGAVYYGTSKTTGAPVAIKKMQINKRNKMKYLLIETELHAKSSAHPNIVAFIESFHLVEQEEFWVVLEFIDGVTLEALLPLPPFREPQMAHVTREVCKALVFVHAKQRLHRDIKLGNVLIGPAGMVKLTDFGLAAQLTTQREQRHTLVGTPDLLAPEVIAGIKYGTEVDVWALGMLVLKMCRSSPLLNMEPRAVLDKLQRFGAPRLTKRKYSPQMKNFIECAVQMKPSDRQTTAQLLQHEWLTKASSDGFDKMLGMLRSTGDTGGGCVIQ